MQSFGFVNCKFQFKNWLTKEKIILWLSYLFYLFFLLFINLLKFSFMEEKFFPMNYGITCAVVLALVAVVLIAVIYVVYKKWKHAQLLSSNLANQLEQAKTDVQSLHNSFQSKSEELSKGLGETKTLSLTFMNIRHTLTIQSIQVQIEQMISEVRAAKECEFLTESKAEVKINNLAMIQNLLKGIPEIKKEEITN